MKIKNSFTFYFLVSLIVLISCNNEIKKTEIKTIDSSTVKASEKLKSLNAQLLANPNSADLYHQRAKYYYDNREFAAGIADMDRAMKIDSSKADYFITMFDLYFVVNKTGQAKAALEKCLKIDPKNMDAMLKLAELHLYVRKYEKSMEYINNALKIDQYNAKAYFMKGMNYKEMKDTTKAISSMQTAVEQDQQYYQAYMQLGILTAAKKNPLAIQYYKNAIRIQPKSVEAWYDLGKFYQDKEDWNNALAIYTTLLKFDNNKFAHYNMGVIYFFYSKTPDIAINHFTEAINFDPKYVEAFYSRGLCYQAMKNLKLAESDFQSCLTINPDFQPAHLALKELRGGE